jgi:hypothetical protein
MLTAIAEGRASVHDLKDYVFIVQKDGKNYLSDGKTIGTEITDSELNLIKAPKVFIDEIDLKV